MKKNLRFKFDCTGLSREEIISNIYKARCIKDIDNFLNPSEDMLIELTYLINIDKTARLVVSNILQFKKFGVYFDVDTDGCTAGTIMTRYLRDCGIEPKTFINKGKYHGIHESKLEELKELDILIVVDSLDSCIDNYKFLKENDVEVVVLDHHDIDEKIPYDEYIYLVSSNRNYKNEMLSGAGVTFKFCMYLDKLLNVNFAENYYDLCAVGLLADVMAVSEDYMENRYLVYKGLNNLKNKAIKKLVGMYEFNSNSILFSIAPLINAAVRYNENEAAMKFLLSDTTSDINKYLKILKKCKERQNDDIKDMMPDIEKQISKQQQNNILFVNVDSDYGISGLIGSKVLSSYKKPVLVLKKKDGNYVGSGRSVACGDFKKICEDIGLGEFAGHPEAFGVVSIKEEDYEKFCSLSIEKMSGIQFKLDIEADIKLSANDLTEDLIEEIKKIDKISGHKFPAINILIETDDYKVKTMSSEKHLVFDIKSGEQVKFIQWNAGDQLSNYEDMEILGKTLKFIGTCDCGFIGREYSNRLILNEVI